MPIKSKVNILEKFQFFKLYQIRIGKSPKKLLKHLNAKYKKNV